MAKQKTKLESEVEAIVKVLGNHPEGASPQQLQEESCLPQVRTLQRRLALLIEEGRIRATGKSNARRYHLIQKEVTIPPEKARETQTVAAIILSAEGQNVLTRVRMPLVARKPVGYTRELLDQYVPNDTHYLSPMEREHLAKTGKTSTMNQPAGTYARQILNRLLIDLSWNSSRLEGNTYSLLDTRRLLEQGAIAEEKSVSETQMILNHKDAIEFIVQVNAGIGFNRYTITSLHALLSNNLLPDPFRLHYRDKIREVVRHILTDALGTTAASAFIKTAALELPATDQARFIHAVETELESLHEGNFARYWVASIQFRRCKIFNSGQPGAKSRMYRRLRAKCPLKLGNSILRSLAGCSTTFASTPAALPVLQWHCQFPNKLSIIGH